MRLVVFLALFSLFAARASSAAPITVAGFTFSAGEVAFADDAYLASGTIRLCGSGGFSTVAEALVGSSVLGCVNNNTGDSGVVEVVFLDNSIVNGSGTDLVIFERSGPMSPGTADPRERFGVSIFSDSEYSPFLEYDPVATGFNSGDDPTLDIFAVQVDLHAFGVASGALVSRLRLHIYDVGLGTKSADITALGAFHSGTPVPEPASGVLIGMGLLFAACSRVSAQQGVAADTAPLRPTERRYRLAAGTCASALPVSAVRRS